MERPFKSQIQFDDLSVWDLKESGSIDWKVNWADILEIATWKEDLWSTDLICIEFRVSENDLWYSCNEEELGWKELLLKLEQQFQVTNSWWSRVAFPAFVPNWTCIWTRPAS